jgi:hypothetical protein
MTKNTKNESKRTLNKVARQKSDFLVDGLHIFVLFGFALAQPLFDLLSKHAEFFVVRKSEPTDVVLLVIILCLVLPGILVLIEGVTGLFGRRFRKAIHWFMVATLLALIALQVLKKILELPGIPLIIIAAVLGVTVSLAYVRFRHLRMFLTVLSPAILIFPALFLFYSPVCKVVFPQKDPSAFGVKIDDPPPIIMVVFDEFTVTSLMDENQQIDPVRYPNFSALAKDAYWFRNATTTSCRTTYAIPAILTGNYPKPSRLPTPTDYPNNIFTLLGGDYEFKILEGLTQLCPSELCEKEAHYPSWEERIESLLLDLSVVYLYILLPTDFQSGLPVITQGWMGFVKKEFEKQEIKDSKEPKEKNVKRHPAKVRRDRSWRFSQFLESIGPERRPTFYYLQILIPHRPWEYLPSGKQYDASRILGTNKGPKGYEMWGNDEWAITQAYQLFLLQVGFADRLIGQLIQRLKKDGLYDDALIVVTADHGISFRSNDYLRIMGESNLGDLMYVPLFIKMPNQNHGEIDDRRISTVDVLPTIADVLGIELPWSADGISALKKNTPERSQIFFLDRGRYEVKVSPNSSLASRNATLAWKLNLFGSGRRNNGLFRVGPNKELISEPLSRLDVVEGNLMVELDRAVFYENVDLNAKFSDSQIGGRICLNTNDSVRLNLAISVNGVIRATTRTLPSKRGAAEWSAMVPETAFQFGKNEVEVFIISKTGDQLKLERTRNKLAVTYFLDGVDARGRGSMTSSHGKTIKVIPRALRGHLDVVEIGESSAGFQGWAADVKNSKLPEAILVFANGKFLFSTKTKRDRRDVAKHFDNAALRRSGYEFAIPFSFLFKDKQTPEVRIFAVLNDIASELKYPKGYKWKKASSSTFELTHGRGREDIHNTKSHARFQIPETVLKDQLSLHLYRNKQRKVSLRWKSTGTFEKMIKGIRNDCKGLTTLYFSPGIYEIDSPLTVVGKNNVQIIGSPGTRLVFPRTLPPSAKLTKEVKPGDKRIYVNRPGLFEKNLSYEAFRPDKKGGFQLEFAVVKVGNHFVEIAPPAYYMSHVRSIPKGCLIYKRYNFFEIVLSNNIGISGFAFDGMNLGEVHGHLNYCGILVRNSHHDARRDKSPRFRNFSVQDCSFENLKGRGVAVYATDNVTIKNCTAKNIGAEVFEIDHMSSGVIMDNAVYDSHIAIQLNDAYNSVVQGNRIENSKYGITVFSIFEDSWVNIDNKILDNDIDFKYIGIKIIGKFNKNILIKNNHFAKREKAIVGDKSGCIIENNFFD